MNNKKIRIGVIFGGPSKEHEVSLASARSVIKALEEKEIDFVPMAVTKQNSWIMGDKARKYLSLQSGDAKEDAISIKQSQALVVSGDTDQTLRPLVEPSLADTKIDLMFPLIHGNYGEDGKLQGFFELFNIPYIFSGSLASALAMDKPKAKIIAKQAGLNVPNDLVFSSSKDFLVNKVTDVMPFPVVIKPAELGSSVGISIANSADELIKGVNEAFSFGDKIMIEAYIKGRELTVGVFGNNPPTALPIVEIIPNISPFYDYKAKYDAGGSTHICPAKIPAAIKNKVETDAITIFKALECRDLARVDFIFDESANDIFFLEINTIPGMTSVSLVPDEARTMDIAFPDFIEMLINEARKRYNI
ncbi:MAG: D-alanine--D-alanine ligase [Patescibacteria group bacterium]|nr:D-alanine--D-alanine ligase [Patescibacteria group bacterium]